MSDLLSPQQLADYLGVPLRTVYSWNHDGTGPEYIRIGKHARYRRDVVEAWLTANTAAKEPAA